MSKNVGRGGARIFSDAPMAPICMCESGIGFDRCDESAPSVRLSDNRGRFSYLARHIIIHLRLEEQQDDDRLQVSGGSQSGSSTARYSRQHATLASSSFHQQRLLLQIACR